MYVMCVCLQHPTALCPPEYMVCFLHRLVAAVRQCWDEGAQKVPGSVSSEGTTSLPPTNLPFPTPPGSIYRLTGAHCLLPAEAYVPPQLFYNGKVDYFDLQRLGGLLSHLKKTLKGRWHCRAAAAANSLDGCSCI